MTYQKAIEKAWEESQQKLLSFIRVKVDTPEDAEDILGDVFIALMKKTNDGGIPDNIISWLYRVTRNKTIDYYRTKKNFEALSEDLISGDESVNMVSQLSRCMLPMIRALPERYQQPLILSEIEGKKYKELASELNLSLPAVKSRIIRGREKLYKSVMACCAMQYDSAGNIMDYQQKGTGSCSRCDK